MGNQNQNHKQQGNQRRNQGTARPLTSTMGNLEPNVVGFTVEAHDLQKMAIEYLRTQGFNVLQSIVMPKDTGRGELHLKQWVFFDRNDNAIRGNKTRQGNNLNPVLQRKMPTGGVGLSDELFRAIAPIALPDGKSRAMSAKGNLVVIEIDPIAILGLLLDVEPGIHRIVITQVQKQRKTVLIDVFKRLEENDFDPGANVDRFTAALRNIR